MAQSRHPGSPPVAKGRLTAHNVAGLARYLVFRARNQRQHTALFFAERGASLELERTARFDVGPGVVFRRNAMIQVRGHLAIGTATFFNESVHICCFDEVTIGQGCRFGELVSIHDENHLVDEHTSLADGAFTTAPVRIGDRVWVGAKATILAGVTIGADAVVAAGAVVNRDVPAGAMVGGVPARVLREGPAGR